jgi:hypothetical protein
MVDQLEPDEHDQGDGVDRHDRGSRTGSRRSPGETVPAVHIEPRRAGVVQLSDEGQADEQAGADVDQLERRRHTMGAGRKRAPMPRLLPPRALDVGLDVRPAGGRRDREGDGAATCCTTRRSNRGRAAPPPSFTVGSSEEDQVFASASSAERSPSVREGGPTDARCSALRRGYAGGDCRWAPR